MNYDSMSKEELIAELAKRDRGGRTPNVGEVWIDTDGDEVALFTYEEADDKYIVIWQEDGLIEVGKVQARLLRTFVRTFDHPFVPKEEQGVQEELALTEEEKVPPLYSFTYYRTYAARTNQSADGVRQKVRSGEIGSQYTLRIGDRLLISDRLYSSQTRPMHFPLSRKAAARFLDVSVGTVNQMIRTGQLSADTTDPGFPISALHMHKLVSSRRVESPSAVEARQKGQAAGCEWLTVAEFAKKHNRSLSTIYRHIRDGNLKAHRRGGQLKLLS